MKRLNLKRRAATAARASALLEALPTYAPDPAVIDAYERSEFGHGWRDYDRDGEDARAEALIAFHLPGRRNRYQLVIDGGRVVSGRWRCRFTRDFIFDAGDLDIDHIVPLKEAWVSGASAWDDDRRARYSNGQGVRSNRRSWLLPVTASHNRAKGARRPDEWMPPLERHHLNYAALWIATKRQWSLGVTAAERAALRVALGKVEV